MSKSTTAGLLLISAMAACGGGGEGAGPAAPSGGAKHELLNNPAPTFALESMNGKGKVDLAQWKGKVVLVDFWATWCEPCKKSFPKLQELYVKYKASGLEIVAVLVDAEKNGIVDFAKTHRAVKFPVGWDDGKKIADKWKPENMPSSYIVGKDGVVKHVHRGYHDGEELEVEKELKALF